MPEQTAGAWCNLHHWRSLRTGFTNICQDRYHLSSQLCGGGGGGRINSMILPNCKQTTCGWHKAEVEASCQLLPVFASRHWASVSQPARCQLWALLVKVEEKA